tara:strand:+ start:18519 stop:19160 length:642 start_codon:yes stop_codon:yes gene_type:complete
MRHFIIILIAVCTLPISVYSQKIENIDEIAPFSEGLAAIRKGNQWGFINEKGDLVIDFRTDVYWNKDADNTKSDISGVKYPMFKKGRCIITQNIEDGIPVFGYINTKGEIAIEPKFLNVFPFNGEYATGVMYLKRFKGENEFKIKIYEYKFFDVLFNTSGDIIEYLNERDHIEMTQKRYKMPWIGAKALAEGLAGVYIDGKGWEIRKVELNTK